ncbi:MAG: AAA family ATPase [Deltaproteobacteria bacterium]|nr:AAA family ATPase [Deltaproteobacteria bacterium]
MTAQRFALGTSDFLRLREAGLRYVDKSAFITEILRSEAHVLLLPRPRRFGKTLNLSTLAAYLERTEQDRSALFEDLAVWQAGDDVRAHFGRHPVLFLTFKDVKERSWADAIERVSRLVATEALRHRATIEAVLSAEERRQFEQLCAATASPVALSQSLRQLSQWLHRATGEHVVILVDDCDAPMHAALQHEYSDDAALLIGNLLSGAFKDNSHLFRGVMTGILGSAKGSNFSGLNNVAVYSLLSRPFAAHFGFSLQEVESLAAETGLAHRLPEIERWYNGYRFGGHTIYNPWSVLSFLANPVDGLKPYWVQTSSDDILRELLVEGGRVDGGDLETLLSGGAITKPVDEHLVLREVRASSASVWSFLLFSGYLRADAFVGDDAMGRPQWSLTVPNLEVRRAFSSLFANFLDRGLGGDDRTAQLCRALLSGDAQTFGKLLGELLAHALSYHDVGGRRPEAVYQAFVVGLLVRLDASHEVSSNREAGYGRVDVLVSPRKPGEAGVVLELKVIDHDEGETAQSALAAALRQVRERDYAAALRERGAGVVHQLGAVFDGKRAWVAAVGDGQNNANE